MTAIPPKKPVHVLWVITSCGLYGTMICGAVYLIPPSTRASLFDRFGLWAVVSAQAIGFVLMIPIWLVLKNWRRQYDQYQRWLKHQCTECAYDLRGHLKGEAGDRCPECGTPIPTPRAQPY